MRIPSPLLCSLAKKTTRVVICVHVCRKNIINMNLRRVGHVLVDKLDISLSMRQKKMPSTSRINPINDIVVFPKRENIVHLRSSKVMRNFFSSTDSTLFKPPNFICRRIILTKISANLYCDSRPWKWFILRYKGQSDSILDIRQISSSQFNWNRCRNSFIIQSELENDKDSLM